MGKGENGKWMRDQAIERMNASKHMYAQSYFNEREFYCNGLWSCYYELMYEDHVCILHLIFSQSKFNCVLILWLKNLFFVHTRRPQWNEANVDVSIEVQLNKRRHPNTSRLLEAWGQ